MFSFDVFFTRRPIKKKGLFHRWSKFVRYSSRNNSPIRRDTSVPNDDPFTPWHKKAKKINRNKVKLRKFTLFSLLSWQITRHSGRAAENINWNSIVRITARVNTRYSLTIIINDLFSNESKNWFIYQSVVNSSLHR